MFSFDIPRPLLPEIIALHGRWQHKDAIVFESSRLSWQEFSLKVCQFASALNRNGIGHGDRVAVVMDNCMETAVSLFGIMAAGAVSVPINLSVNNETLAVMINDAGAVGVITTGAQQARIDIIREQLPSDLRIISTAPCDADHIDWRTLLESGEVTDALPVISDDDVLNIIYSSGTTGQPKGIVHTHRGRLDWAYDLSIALRYHANARTLITIGMYSNISWVAMLCTLLAGGTLVIEPGFDAAGSHDTIEREQITNLSMVPIQYQRMVAIQQSEPRDLSSLSAVMSCGSPLQPTLKQELFALLPCGVIELYGLTEGLITTLQPEEAEGRWSSVGRPLPGTDVKILDDDNKELPVGEAGELVSRGRIMMPGYLNREDATRDACWTDERGHQWLRSGDIAKMDDAGFLYIVDRKKDMILTGGQNVYPQDIEAVIATHTSVDDVAVIPAKSDRWGETPVALIVLNEDSADKSTDKDEIIAWCNERVGKQQRLADAIFVDDLPRNPNGKILKKELREKYKDLHY